MKIKHPETISSLVKTSSLWNFTTADLFTVNVYITSLGTNSMWCCFLQSISYSNISFNTCNKTSL